MSFLFRGHIATDELFLQFLYIFIFTFSVRARNNIYSSPNRMLNYENLHIVKFVCQLIADLQKGRTYNSYLIIRSCVYILFGGHPSTDKLILQFVYILHFLFWLELILIPFLVWTEFDFDSSQNRKCYFENMHKL